MPGNKIGGKRAAAANKRFHGDDFYKRIGSLGGQKKVKKGFAMMSPEKIREAGKKGGTNSRRGKKNG